MVRSGVKPARELVFAPRASKQSGGGGNEIAEAFGAEGR